MQKADNSVELLLSLQKYPAISNTSHDFIPVLDNSCTTAYDEHVQKCMTFSFAVGVVFTYSSALSHSVSS